MRNRATPVADVQERRLRKRRQQLVCRVRGKGGRALVVPGIAVHGMSIAVKRVEPGVCIPGLVEVNAIDARIQQFFHAPGVVAEAVVRRVGDDSVDRPRLDALGYQRIRLDRGLDRVLLEPRRRDGADDSVTISQRNEIIRNAAGHHEAVFDRLVAVPVAQRNLVACDRSHEYHAVRHRRAVRDAVRPVRTEHASRIPFVLADRARVVQQ